MHDVAPRLAALLDDVEPPFTLRDAAARGISRWVLDRLVRQGRVERLGRGLYAPLPPAPAHDEARVFPFFATPSRARAFPHIAEPSKELRDRHGRPTATLPGSMSKAYRPAGRFADGSDLLA